MVVVLGCGGLATVTAARALGLSSNGPLNVCLDRGIPAADAGALSTTRQWLPIGIRCEWSTGDGVVVDGPRWSDTVLVAAAAFAAGAAVVAVLRWERRHAEQLR